MRETCVWIALALLGAACGGGADEPSPFKAYGGSAGFAGQGAAGSGMSGGSTTAGSGGSTTAGSGGSTTAGSGGSTTAGCGGTKQSNGVDDDGDGFADPQDCNDCDPNVNPGAFDTINYEKDANGKPTTTPLPDAAQVDENCDGKARLPSDDVSCDANLALDSLDPRDAARAIGICQDAGANGSWGLVDAKLSGLVGGFGAGTPGKPVQYGVVPSFGPANTPREGKKMWVISSGAARAPGQADYQSPTGVDHGTTSPLPDGFPKASNPAQCGQTEQPHDAAGLDVKIRVPTNAKQLKFKFRFFTYEYPSYACSKYFDVFAVLMAPFPASPDPTEQALLTKMAPDISFDPSGNAIGVNNPSFFTSCVTATTPVPYPHCTGDTAALQGTGFETHGATAWLVTSASFDTKSLPNREVTLRFATWDSLDGVLDSTTLVDDFSWSTEEAPGARTIVDPEGPKG